jgi:hypothetical protein
MWKTTHGLVTQYQISLDEITNADASVVRGEQSDTVIMQCSKWVARAVFIDRKMLAIELSVIVAHIA